MISKNNNKRNKKILELYKDGNTLADIGEKYRFSRSRSQQIVISELKKEIMEEFGLTHVFGEDKIRLEMAAKEEMQSIFKKRKKDEKIKDERDIINRIEIKLKQIPSYKNFIALSDFAKALGETVDVIKKYLPEIADSIVSTQKNKWSRLYNKCRSCGTSTIKHRSHGLCVKCFPKSDIFKEAQEASRLRNQKKWERKQKKYRKQYAKRTEVIKRRKKIWDMKEYNGNREKALERDKYKCKKCGMSQEESYKKLKKDLFVKRVKKGNNDLNNLITMCSKCFFKKNINKI